jgi:hypothetical protein
MDKIHMRLPTTNMKIKPEDYQALLSAIKPLANKIKSHREYLKNNRLFNDLETRLRWDLLWASKFDLTPLYQYMNDDHIDTALRCIVNELS